MVQRCVQWALPPRVEDSKSEKNPVTNRLLIMDIDRTLPEASTSATISSPDIILPVNVDSTFSRVKKASSTDRLNVQISSDRVTECRTSPTTTNEENGNKYALRDEQMYLY